MGMTNRVVAMAWAALGVLVPVAAAGLLLAPALRVPALLAALALAATVLVSATHGARRLLFQAAEHERQALQHPVTDLPNRLLFHDRTYQAITHAKRHGGAVAVLLLDLDRFKEVNDTLGHHNGDLLLHLVGARLRRDLREGDTVARLGGDEFAVLLRESGGPEHAREVAERLRAALDERFELEGIGLEVEASTGIALFPLHGRDPDTLLQRADVAMYAAKEAHTGIEVYQASDDDSSRERLAIVAGLREAIDLEQIVLHFQPKADLVTARITGVEALVRWQHPERGLLYPDSFIPVAEHTGLMRPLTSHVLELALRQCREWRDEGLELDMAVNLSTRNLLDLSLPAEVTRRLAAHGLPAGALELEITETTIMADAVRAKIVLDQLAEIGVRLAIDDFGTGYTSLAWLRDLPVATLKIDKSFVIDMGQREQDAVIVRSSVQLGRNLGLQVVAEGVEDEAAWRHLVALGCDQAQGYFLSRPQPAGTLTAWLRSYRPGEALTAAA